MPCHEASGVRSSGRRVLFPLTQPASAKNSVETRCRSLDRAQRNRGGSVPRISLHFIRATLAARPDLPRRAGVHRENADLDRQKAVAHGNPPCATPSGKAGIGRICRRARAKRSDRAGVFVGAAYDERRCGAFLRALHHGEPVGKGSTFQLRYESERVSF